MHINYLSWRVLIHISISQWILAYQKHWGASQYAPFFHTCVFWEPFLIIGNQQTLQISMENYFTIKATGRREQVQSLGTWEAGSVVRILIQNSQGLTQLHLGTINYLLLHYSLSLCNTFLCADLCLPNPFWQLSQFISRFFWKSANFYYRQGNSFHDLCVFPKTHAHWLTSIYLWLWKCCILFHMHFLDWIILFHSKFQQDWFL